MVCGRGGGWNASSGFSIGRIERRNQYDHSRMIDLQFTKGKTVQVRPTYYCTDFYTSVKLDGEAKTRNTTSFNAPYHYSTNRIHPSDTLSHLLNTDGRNERPRRRLHQQYARTRITTTTFNIIITTLPRMDRIHPCTPPLPFHYSSLFIQG